MGALKRADSTLDISYVKGSFSWSFFSTLNAFHYINHKTITIVTHTRIWPGINPVYTSVKITPILQR